MAEPRRPAPKVFGDDMSGADQWAWAMRLLRHAAGVVSDGSYAADVAAFDSMGRLLDELDEEALRGVAAHLALAPRRIGSIAFSAEGLDDLAVRLAWSWSDAGNSPPEPGATL
jgi:hypothetical protein